jgi:hypothetical protein
MADHAQILFTLQYRSMADEWRLSEHDHTWVTDDVINRIYNKKTINNKTTCQNSRQLYCNTFCSSITCLMERSFILEIVNDKGMIIQ